MFAPEFAPIGTTAKAWFSLVDKTNSLKESVGAFCLPYEFGNQWRFVENGSSLELFRRPVFQEKAVFIKNSTSSWTASLRSNSA